VALALAGPYANHFTLLQTDNHASTSSVSFLQVGCSSWHPSNSVKALYEAHKFIICLPALTYFVILYSLFFFVIERGISRHNFHFAVLSRSWACLELVQLCVWYACSAW